MIGIPETDLLCNAIICGTVTTGLSATTADGKPAHLAIVDEDGRIIEQGWPVAREAWNVTLKVYKNFLIGHGYLQVFSDPPSKIDFGWWDKPSA